MKKFTYLMALYQEYKPSSYDSNIFVPVSEFLRPVKTADDRDKKIDETEFNSYIVMLKDINIRKAYKKEITFK